MTSISKGQNLVPNSDFEVYSSCPVALDQVYLSTGWSSYRYSPDYFNSCNSGVLGIPTNGVGYQSAYSGNAYAGFIAFDVNGDSREIIGSQLSQALSIGQNYFVSMRVSLAEFQPSPPQYIPCNKIGIKFSTVPFSASAPPPINNFAHVFTDSIISDTMNWITIQGSFIADSVFEEKNMMK